MLTCDFILPSSIDVVACTRPATCTVVEARDKAFFKRTGMTTTNFNSCSECAKDFLNKGPKWTVVPMIDVLA